MSEQTELSMRASDLEAALRDLWLVFAARPDIMKAVQPLMGWAEHGALNRAQAELDKAKIYPDRRPQAGAAGEAVAWICREKLPNGGRGPNTIITGATVMLGYEGVQPLYAAPLVQPTPADTCPACNGAGTEADYAGDDMRPVEGPCHRCGGTGRVQPTPAEAVTVKALEQIANPSTVAGMHDQDRAPKLQEIARSALVTRPDAQPAQVQVSEDAGELKRARKWLDGHRPSGCGIDTVEMVAALAARIEAYDAAFAELKEERDELQQLFDMRWEADMRAVKRWREANPGNDLVLPDHADLVVWLLETRP